MLLANRKFNHETDSFHESLGIPGDIRTKCRERVFFTAISNAFQREELFEDPDDAPKELRTVSGDLQRCLQSITDQLEYEYTLMIFTGYQRMAKEIFGYYKHLQENQDNKEDRLKSMIIELVSEMRSKHEEDEEDEEDAPIDKLDKKSMMKRISFVKKSHHNFDTYMNMLRRWADGNNSNNTEKKPDIDDLLRKLFSNEDE
jgi:hypothetical protein